MLIEELISEYNTDVESDPREIADEGNDLAYDGELTWVDTPLAQRGIKVGYEYSKFWQGHRYFLFYKNRCFGLFEIDDPKRFKSYPANLRRSLEYTAATLNPGVNMVTPHLSLLPKFQGTGIGSVCYTTFLTGGNWIFNTFGHSEAASKLWDSLANKNFISFYIDKNGQLSWEPIRSPNSIRVLGPASRFKVTPDSKSN